MSDHNEAVMVVKGMSPVHVRLRSRLGSLLAASVALDLVASVVIYFAEQGQSGTGIRTFGDALFWTSTQLLTVSSNLPNPLSTPARILDVALQVWAISIVAILAGSFGAFFHHRGMEELHTEPSSRSDVAPRPPRDPSRS
jgi:hypothetical protein